MDTTLIRAALIGNAIFSATSAAVVIIFAGPLSNTFDVPIAVLVVLGIGLLPWAAFAWFTSRSLARAPVVLIIAGDLAWVIGTVILIAGFPDAMAPAGKFTFAAIAAVVAMFGVTQLVGLRRAGGLRSV